MMKTALALSTLLAAGSAGALLAQEQIDPPAISGTIESVDPTSRSIVLEDGQTYMMGDSAELGSLQPGARVDLTCDTNGANCTVVSSGPPNVSPELGTEPSAGPGQGDGGGDSGGVPPGDSGPDSGSRDSDGAN